MRNLMEALKGIPHLDGAACAGKPHLFDVDPAASITTMRNRQQQALNVCKQCPALEACGNWTTPDPGAAVWAQGGKRMFNIDDANKRRIKNMRLKRQRRAKAQDEQAHVRDEAKRLLREWKQNPR